MSWLTRLFRSPATQPVPRTEALQVVEGVESHWSYHLAEPGGSFAYKKALCGRDRLMGTSIPLTGWGYRTLHIRERYCEKCAQAALDRGISLPPLRDPV